MKQYDNEKLTASRVIRSVIICYNDCLLLARCRGVFLLTNRRLSGFLKGKNGSVETYGLKYAKNMDPAAEELTF